MTYLKAKCITCGKKRDKLGTIKSYQCQSCIDTINVKVNAANTFSYNRIRTYEMPITFAASLIAVENNVLRLNIDKISKINIQHNVTKFIQRNRIIKSNSVNCIFLENEIVAVASRDFYALDQDFNEYELTNPMFQHPIPLDVAAKIFITGPINRSFILIGVGAIKIRDE